MSNTTVGLLTIAAIFLGPLAALQAQKWLDQRRESRNRKLMIFKTLMTYRATPVSPLFVQALNLIDVEFSSDSKDEKEVRTAWKILLDHFSDLAKVVGGVSELTHERTADLLLVMGKCLGYEFDRVYLKKGGYYPQGLGNVEMEQHTLRRMLLDLLDGKRRLPIATFEQKFPDLVDRPQDDDGER